MKHSALFLFVVFACSAAFGAPFGMPPADNPVTAKVAPEDCIGYISWAGSAEADSQSGNQTERLLANPAFQKAVDQGRTKIKDAASGMLDQILAVAIDKSTCIFSSPELTGKNAGLVCLGDSAAQVSKELVAAMRKLVKDETITSEFVSINGIKFCKNSVADSESEIYWGFLGKKKEYLLFSDSEDGIKMLMANAKTPAPKWLAEAKAGLPIDRRSSFSWLNMDKIMENQEQVFPADMPADQKAFAKMGYELSGANSIDSIASTAGLDKKGTVQQMVIKMKDGWKTTLPGMITQSSLTTEDLSVVPSENVVFAVVGKTSLKDMLTAITQNISSLDDVPAEGKQQIAAVSMIANEYLKSLGNVMALYITQDGTNINGGFVASLSNAPAAKIQLKKLMGMAQGMLQGNPADSGVNLNNSKGQSLAFLGQGGDEDEDGEDLLDDDQGADMMVQPGGMAVSPAAMAMMLMPDEIVEAKIGGKDGWLLKKEGIPEPMTPAIVIINKVLFVGTKSAAEAYVKFDAAKNIGTVADVAKLMKNKPSHLIYADVVKFSSLQPENPVSELLSKITMPFVGSVYADENTITVNTSSCLPLPDFITLFTIATNIAKNANK